MTQLDDIESKLNDIWQLLGLDRDNPVTISPTGSAVGAIQQSYTGQGASTILTRTDRITNTDWSATSNVGVTSVFDAKIASEWSATSNVSVISTFEPVVTGNINWSAISNVNVTSVFAPVANKNWSATSSVGVTSTFNADINTDWSATSNVVVTSTFDANVADGVDWSFTTLTGLTSASAGSSWGGIVGNTGAATLFDSGNSLVVAGYNGTWQELPLGTTDDPASYNGASALSSGSNASTILSVSTNPTGTKLWSTYFTFGGVYELTLATANTLTGSNFTSGFTEVVPAADIPAGGNSWMLSNGNAFYVLNYTSSIVYRIPLSTPYDFSSKGTITSVDLDTVTGVTTLGMMRGIAVNSDESQMLVVSEGSAKVHLLDFGTNGDLSTLTENSTIAEPSATPGPVMVDHNGNLVVLDYDLEQAYRYT